MTNWILQERGTKQPRLLVAIEMSLKAWRLAMAVEGQTRKRVKTVEAGNYLELLQAVEDAQGRFKLAEGTAVVFCYEAGREGFHPDRRLTELGG